MYASVATIPLPRRLTAVALASLLALASVLAGAGPADARKPDHAGRSGVHFWLTVLHNNDGESRLISASGQPDFGGIARFVTLMNRLQHEAVTGPPASPGAKRGVVTVSSGDNFLAGPQLNASFESGAPFYDALALSRVNYDAIAIGNHEFDFGPATLARFITSFSPRVPFLSANLDVSSDPHLGPLAAAGIIAPSTVVTERGERIGIVGATTPRLPSISSPGPNVVINEMVADAINAEIARLEGQGVNKFVVISHLQSVAEDLALAPMLNGVDIMVAGGGDEVLANPSYALVPGDVRAGDYPLWTTRSDGKAVPVVTTAGDYKYVGRLIGGFDKDGELLTETVAGGPVRVASLNFADGVPADPWVQANVVEPVQAYVADLATTPVATSTVDLDGRRTQVRTTETNLGNLIADGMLWQGQRLAASFGVAPPQVALQNGGGIRNDSIIPAGTITALDTFAILPFGNFTSVVPNVPAAQFKELLENAVSRWEFVDGRFAQVAGFSFTYNPAGTAQIVDNAGNVLTPGNRVTSVILDDGTVLVSGGVVVAPPGLTISVATNAFSAAGGDQYPFRGLPFTTLGVTDQQTLAQYLGHLGTVTAADYPFGGEGRIEP
jgi:2',3'-cyclic-nucleotide 2'-phosphodiesterase (5'-nucleotidase family)